MQLMPWDAIERRGCRPNLTYLSLGAGVQSSTMLLMYNHWTTIGYNLMPDLAIFADTGAEPSAVYAWLEQLKELSRIPIVTVKTGDGLENHIKRRIESGGFIDVPFYAKYDGDDDTHFLKRQCTYQYKVEPITAEAKRRLGVKKGRRVRGGWALAYIGISTDEIQRMKPSRLDWVEHAWPLIDVGMSRQDCLDWLQAHAYPIPPKSACYFCPFHGDDTWRNLRDTHPVEFAKAADMDRRLYEMRPGMHIGLHRTLLPLQDAIENGNQTEDFDAECEGMCGV